MLDCLINSTRQLFRQNVKIFRYLPVTLLLASMALQAEESQKQASLTREIRDLSSTLDSQKDASDELQAEVTSLEKKIGDISKQQYQTEKKLDDTNTRLQDANVKKQKMDAELNAQKAGLAQQLQALYTAGEQSYLRLLLRQDEPADISRTVRYFGYMNDNRIGRIKKIQTTLKSLDTLRATIDKDRLDMQTLTATLDKQKDELQSIFQERSGKLSKLERDINSKEKRLTKLKREEDSLQSYVAQLSTRPDSSTTNNNSAPTTPASAAVKATKTPSTPSTTKFVPNTAFSKLKGKLQWPVDGKIIHSYNTARNEKQRWRGVVIAAKGGTKVRAIASGKVAFAGWMNGYGHLIIIEHDKNYMSLYGYNRAVYKREGDIVKANESIAAVGNSSGQSQDGLYFEIRQGTLPQNPASWCR